MVNSIEGGMQHAQEVVLDKIEGADISIEMPMTGETEIILQRHEKYISDKDDERAGSLTEESAQNAYRQSVEIFEKKLESIPDDDRQNVRVLVVGSTTKHYDKGQRSMETADIVARAVKDTFEKNGLDESNLLNTHSELKGDNVRPADQIQAPRMFDDNLDFVNYLNEKYGKLTQDFWCAFEEDWEKEKREEMGAEGTFDLLERFSKYIDVLSRFSRMYHSKNPDKRLLIWTVSHYDTVSPYVKNKITKTDPSNYLPVDYGGGVSINIDKDQKRTSLIKGKEYEI